ncbi:MULTISPECIES: DNA sulfur modification protein DndD [Marinobacter]|uniref:DNA sulfur modification protein DndD n=1 Tax=Marinobacter TaxID=2742 RepID=UPI003B42A0DB|nr:DNA sulfur modification protein DndD [Marinobacter alkaliphilus]
MAKLTIESISIENLGPFREQQTFDLSVHPERPVILIKALNGSGKTTLLNALQVGLYGYKAINPARRSDYEQFIASLQRTDATGIARIEMKLVVEIGSDRKDLDIRREWIEKDSGYRERFRVFESGVELLGVADEWDDFINGILPVELVHLFLFDGEKIEALANPDRLPALLKRATEVFLGLEGIDALNTDLKAVERRAGSAKTLRESTSEAQSQVDEYGNQLTELEQRISLLSQQKANAQSQLDSAQRKLDEYTVSAQQSGLKAYEQAASLKAKVEFCKERQKHAQAAVVEALENPYLPLAWLGDLWVKYKDQWQKAQKTRHSHLLKEEFSKRDERVVNAITDPSVRSIVESVLNEDLARLQTDDGNSPALLEGGNPLEIEPRIDSAKVQLNLARQELDTAQADLEKAQKQVDQIPAEEQISDILRKMQELAQKVSDAEKELRNIEKELDEARSYHEHIESRLNAALLRMRSEFKENTFQLKALEASDRAKRTLEIFRERLLASKAQWLSDMITQEFKQLLRKRNLISRVRVEPESYAVSIEDANGHNLPMERLSAGERQMLAISVLSALIRERKGRFPVVVDTPLARLDRQHRESLIHNFFAKISHQVLVLSTDEEVEGNAYRAVSSHLNREFSLAFDEAERRSVATVEPAQLNLESVV